MEKLSNPNLSGAFWPSAASAMRLDPRVAAVVVAEVRNWRRFIVEKIYGGASRDSTKNGSLVADGRWINRQLDA